MEIQFAGIAGITQHCIDAVLRYLQFCDSITKLLILTNNHNHALVLYTEQGEVIAIKAGFASGYPGEGPRGLAYILTLLNRLEIEINEYDAAKKVIEKIDSSRLTDSELDKIVNSMPVRPTRWRSYIYDYENKYSTKELLARFPCAIPFTIIDSRLFDLAVSFRDAPGDKILQGFKRLEDLIRERCGLDDHGSKLFQKAFLGDKSILFWPRLNTGEITSRANLFIFTYGTFRNRRAHKEIEEDSNSQLTEFLALNLLFILEAESKMRSNNGDQGVSVDNDVVLYRKKTC
jgi:hypothetical protein